MISVSKISLNKSIIGEAITRNVVFRSSFVIKLDPGAFSNFRVFIAFIVSSLRIGCTWMIELCSVNFFYKFYKKIS